MSKTLLIAGGGTGGHLFPAVAVARTIKRMRPELELAFVGAGKALESRTLEQEGFKLEVLKVTSFRGRGIMGRARSLSSMPLAIWQARKLIKSYRPGLVLAVGGYAAVPLGLAARLCGLPLAVQEQNTVPGLTNRVLGKRANVVFTAFPEAKGYFPAAKVEYVGNPVRPELVEQAEEAKPARRPMAEGLKVLVLGGSQGARSINQAMTQSLPQLEELGQKIFIRHQSGPSDEAWVKEAYAASGVPHEVSGFIDDMGKAYAEAHLVICRSGAGTVTELMCVGRASVCVPYPHAADDHQTKNAASLVNAGAAELIPDPDLSPAAITKLIGEFIENPGRITEMEAAAASLAKPRAAEDIARGCLKLMEVK